MTRTFRVEPITEERDETYLVGWRVVDVTNPDFPTEVSRHDTEPEAIEAARNYERDSTNEPGSSPDDTQDYDASDPNAGKFRP